MLKAHRLVYHSALGSRVTKQKKRRRRRTSIARCSRAPRSRYGPCERELFIDNQLVQVHFITVERLNAKGSGTSQRKS